MKRVVILKEGPYNDEGGRARWRKEGEELETQEWYAGVLVEAGLARWPEEGATSMLKLDQSDISGELIRFGGATMAEEERGETELRTVTEFGGVVPEEVVERLYERGIMSLEDVEKATDKELLKVQGIGPGRLRKLRELSNAGSL